MEDTTLGWRFVNPLMKSKCGVDSMPETGENVAEEFHISRKDQDLFALRSQQRAAVAIRSGKLKQEIVAVPIPQKTGDRCFSLKMSIPGQTRRSKRSLN